MSAFLTLASVSLSTPDARPLFADLTLAIGRERTGIVGRNGCGKSTLLRLMAGAIEPASGTVARAGSVALLRQDWADTGRTVAQAMDVADALDRVVRVTDGTGSIDDMARADWTLEARIDAALADVALDRDMLARPLGTLSGGERTRVAIAAALLAAPNVLLLDEPTNNLDAAGRARIAELVARWPGGVVAASHDRALLGGMERIIELAPTGITIVGGGWPAFAAARDAARARAAADLDRAERALEATAADVQRQRERKARRDKAGRAWRAKGADSKLFLDAERGRAERSHGRDRDLAERLLGDAQAARDTARARVEVLTPLDLALPPSGLPANRRVLAIDAVTLDRGGRRVLGPLSFEIVGPRRIALTGPNGAGKTSLLHIVAGLIVPDTGGVATLDDGVVLLDQHVAALDPATSILDNLRRLAPHIDRNAAHAALARFAFRNRAADRRVDTLSGGERLRAGLACAFATATPRLLLLDEPTNHLDLPSIELLERALAGFDGAMIVASHDTRFLDALAIDREIALPHRASGD